MELNLLLKIAIVFVVFFIIDIVFHILLKIKRNAAECCLTVIMGLAFIGTAVLGVLAYADDSDNDRQDIYMAYCYMEDGNIDQASAILDGMSGTSEEQKLLSIACAVQNGDYINGHFKAQELLAAGKISEAGKKCLTALDEYCVAQLGIVEGEKNAVITDYGTYLTQLETENASANDAEGETTSSNEVLELVTEYIDEQDFSRKEQRQYEKQYEMDGKIHSVAVSELTETDIRELKHEYGETEEVLRREISYYVYQRDFESALDKCADLNEKYESPENVVIYTDVIAEQAYQSQRSQDDDSYDTGESTDEETSVYDKKDDEVKKYLKKAERAEENAQELINEEGYDGSHADEINEYLEEADQNYKEANNVQIKRAINYITAKEPASGDDTGFYELQLAKMYLVMDDRDTANEHLHNVIDNSTKIDESSSLKDAVDEVVTQYNQISDDSYNAELNAAVYELVDQQSSNVVPVSDDTINGSFNSYVSTTLKYDRISIHISRIDTSAYPAVTAYVNINGTKDSEEELANEFTKDDFTVIDTQYEITDFTLKSGAESGSVNIGIVMDKSGSMEGSAIENAKQAATEAVNHMEGDNQRMMVISYDDAAYMEQGLTSQTGILKNSISNIASAGGTNISAGLNLALDTLIAENGARAVILMSDGQDGGSEEDMSNAVERAVNAGISVYTVGFGDCNDTYIPQYRPSDTSDLSPHSL